MTTETQRTSRLDDPAFYSEVKTRFEAGERKTLMRDHGIGANTLYHWARDHGWTHLRSCERVEQQRKQALVMIAEGKGNYAISAATGLAPQTVKAMRELLPDAPRPKRPVPAVPPPSLKAIDHDDANDNTYAGWWCGCGARYADWADLAAHKAAGKHLYINPGSLDETI